LPCRDSFVSDRLRGNRNLTSLLYTCLLPPALLAVAYTPPNPTDPKTLAALSLALFMCGCGARPAAARLARQTRTGRQSCHIAGTDMTDRLSPPPPSSLPLPPRRSQRPQNYVWSGNPRALRGSRGLGLSRRATRSLGPVRYEHAHHSPYADADAAARTAMRSCHCQSCHCCHCA
jgi:hypothetical protein